MATFFLPLSREIKELMDHWAIVQDVESLPCKVGTHANSPSAHGLAFIVHLTDNKLASMFKIMLAGHIIDQK